MSLLGTVGAEEHPSDDSLSHQKNCHFQDVITVCRTEAACLTSLLPIPANPSPLPVRS